MTAELTAEQIVTNLLLNNEILKNSDNGVCKTSTTDLGDFLNSSIIKSQQNLIRTAINEPTKYTFIKSCDWKFL